MDLNEIKKDLYKSKEMAKFSHYQKGRLFYEVKFLDNVYQFPIDTVEEINKNFILETGEVQTQVSVKMLILSEDLGETIFSSEIKGSELIRWIGKAIKNEEIRKVG